MTIAGSVAAEAERAIAEMVRPLSDLNGGLSVNWFGRFDAWDKVSATSFRVINRPGKPIVSDVIITCHWRIRLSRRRLASSSSTVVDRDCILSNALRNSLDSTVFEFSTKATSPDTGA